MGVAIGGLAREVRAASLLAFLLSLPIAFLALVPSGAVAPALYDVINVDLGGVPVQADAARARRDAQRLRRSRSPARCCTSSRSRSPTRAHRPRRAAPLRADGQRRGYALRRDGLPRDPSAPAAPHEPAARPRARDARRGRRPRPAAVRAHRGRARRRSRRCRASTGSRSRRRSRRPARPRALGLGGVLLFGIPADKDEEGSGAWDDEGVVQLATRAIKDAHPDLVVMADLCLCEYTSHGHCGLVARRRLGRQRRVASSCSPAPRSRRRARAPTSSRRAT